MPRKLIPPKPFDRFSAIGGLVFLVIGIAQLVIADYTNAAASGAAVLLSILNAYVFQTQLDTGSSTSEYSKVLDQVGSVGKQIAELGRFLEHERSRVAATEETIKQLNAERSKLEPIIETERASVEAILAAHADRTARNAWKERMFGFFLGVVASIVASYLYEMLKR